MEALPAEILSAVFILAADEDVIFQHGLPTSMAESTWFHNFFTGAWTLRHPSEALNVLQRRSYSTKKSIMLTCKTFHRVASELMFHCLFFNGTAKLNELCTILDSANVEPSPAWWTRRVHITCYDAQRILSSEHGIALCSILRHATNLEIAMLAIPTTTETLMMVADTLCTFNKRSLRTLHLSMPVLSVSKLIWMLSLLPNLTCLHVSFTSSKDQAITDEEDIPDLGAAHEILLAMPHLGQLSLFGHTGPFMEQAAHWHFPSLRFLTLNTYHSDIMPFLDMHGSNLTFLDVTCIHRVPIDQAILRCPRLTTLCFNADWSLDGEIAHEHVHSVGLHGLKMAFSPSTADTTNVFPLDSLIRRANDSNFASVTTFGHFPKLERVRVLSGPVLSELERRGGPEGAPPGPYGYTDDSEDGMKRWERWWDACAQLKVRLEDCTGGELGHLPSDEYEDDQSDDEPALDSVQGEESEEEWEEYSWEYEVPPIDNDTSGVSELRKLIEECRDMERGREA